MVATGYVSTTGDPRKVNVAGQTMTGDLVLNDGTPDTANSAASKSYVDSVAGDVVGPASSTDNAVARWDGTTGGLLQNSGATLSDAGALTFVGGRSTADLFIGTVGQKAYRLKQSGGALNFDASGTPLYIGVFSAVDFVGTERTYLRLESGVELAHAGGRWEFATNVEGAAVHAIDPTTGVAELGAKNSLTNIRIAGYKTTTSAPTTGTWAVGDTVLALDGWYRCTVAGTPGTWVALFPTTLSLAGDLVVQSDVWVNDGVLRISGEAGTFRQLQFGDSATSDDTSVRWSVQATNAAESGGNVGSDWRIVRYSDTGVALDSPLFLKRSSGYVGINTNNPLARLVVQSDEGEGGVIVKAGAAGTAAVALLALETPTAGKRALDFRLTGDSTFRLRIDAGTSSSGTITFGDGTTADTSLYRSATATLATDASFRHLGTGLGFYGAAAATKQTIVGSRGGNAALASALTALAALGLITDSTTA